MLDMPSLVMRCMVYRYELFETCCCSSNAKEMGKLCVSYGPCNAMLLL